MLNNTLIFLVIQLIFFIFQFDRARTRVREVAFFPESDEIFEISLFKFRKRKFIVNYFCVIL